LQLQKKFKKESIHKIASDVNTVINQNDAKKCNGPKKGFIFFMQLKKMYSFL